MLNVRFQPMPKWSRTPPLVHRQDQFMTKYEKTLDKLEYEIGRLAGSEIRIEAGFTIEQLRNDGWPKAGQYPAHPGVVLYFETEADGALCFPCGTYNSMRANLHAIALTLESLRAIDRYGVTLQHEQYRGFAALPEASAKMTVDAAAGYIAETIGIQASAVLSSYEAYRAAYRGAAVRLHPDNAGGAAGYGFQKLVEAKEVLDAHWGDPAKFGGTKAL